MVEREKISPDNHEARQETLVPEEESRKLASQLLSRYQSEILAQQSKDVNGWGHTFEPEPYQQAISHYLREIPTETLSQYLGHGVSKGNEEQRLAAGLNILANSTIKGWVAPLAEGDWQNAIDNVDFLIVLNKENPFPPRLADGTPQRNEAGLKINLGAVVVNTQFYPLVLELHRLFPDTRIIMARQIPEYFKKG